MPGLFTILSAKLHYFCCSWIIWGDSAGINWQPKCHFACRAEATNRTRSFNSRALRLRAHTAPFESSPRMGLTEQVDQICCCRIRANRATVSIKTKVWSSSLPVSETSKPFSPSHACATGWFMFQEAPCLIFQVGYRPLRTQCLRNGQSAPLFYQYGTFK